MFLRWNKHRAAFLSSWQTASRSPAAPSAVTVQILDIRVGVIETICWNQFSICVGNTAGDQHLYMCVCEGSVSHTYTLSYSPDLILLKSQPFFWVHLASSLSFLILPLVDISTHTLTCPTLPLLYLYPLCWLFLISSVMSAENAALDFSHSGKVSCMRRRLVVKGCSRDLLEALWSFFVRKLISQFMSYVCW